MNIGNGKTDQIGRKCEDAGSRKQSLNLEEEEWGPSVRGNLGWAELLIRIPLPGIEESVDGLKWGWGLML